MLIYRKDIQLVNFKKSIVKGSYEMSIKLRGDMIIEDKYSITLRMTLYDTSYNDAVNYNPQTVFREFLKLMEINNEEYLSTPIINKNFTIE